MQLNTLEQAQLDEYLSDTYWPEPDYITAIFAKLDQIKEDKLDEIHGIMPERQVRLDVDPMTDLLGEDSKGVYEMAVKHFRARWKGISFADLKQEMLIKAYELKDKPQPYLYKALRNTGLDFIKSEIRHSARFIPAGNYFNDEHLEATNGSLSESEEYKAGDLMKDNYVEVGRTKFDISPRSDRSTPITNNEVLKSFLIIYALDPLALTSDNRIIVAAIYDSLPPHYQSSILAYSNGNTTSKDRMNMSRLLGTIDEGLYV